MKFTPLLLALLAAPYAAGFASGPLLLPRAPRVRASGRNLGVSMMAISEDEVAKWLEKGQAAAGGGAVAKIKTLTVSKALQKATKATAVAIECSPAMPVGVQAKKDELQIVGPAGFSKALRELKYNGIFVKVDSDSDREVLEALCEEQQAAKGEFPGPVAVVQEGVKTLEEAAMAKAAGCAAVTVSIDDASEDMMKGLQGMVLESIISVTPSNVAAAVELSPNLICVEMSVTDDDETMKEARSAIPKGIAAVAVLEVGPMYREDDNGIGLDQTVRDLKDNAGFLAVLLKGLLDGSEEDLEAAPWAIAQATSKKSTQVTLRLAGNTREDLGEGRARSSSSSDMPSDMSDMPRAPPPRKNPSRPGGGTRVGGDTLGLDEFM